MKDYIDALLMYLSEERLTGTSSEYFARLACEEEACEALCRALTPEQHKLFLTYEAARNATASAAEDAYARQAFLLARDIFR